MPVENHTLAQCVTPNREMVMTGYYVLRQFVQFVILSIELIVQFLSIKAYV